MKHVDTVLNARWLIPIEPCNTVYDNHSLVIHEGKIVDILASANVAEKYSAKEMIDLSSHAILPGFVNAHTHSPMTLFRGLADDLPLMEWLNNHIWPAETKWLSDEFISDGTEIALAEMIKSGTTCFNEHFFFPEAIIKVTDAAKMRATIGATIINFPTNWSKNELDGFAKFQQLQQQLGDSPLISISLAPHSPYGTTDEVLEKIAAYSKEHDLPIHMHVHETDQEVSDSIKQFGKRPLQRLHDLGLLSPRFQAVHMTQLNEADFDLLTTTKTSVTHCPESNLKLASGFCHVQKLLDYGINVALGTDGAASNNDLDMIGEIRTAALLGKAVANNATAVCAPTALQMATLNSAKALGLSEQIGSLKIGKLADVIAINLDSINTQPVYNPISHIVYSTTHTQVTDVWVNGVRLLKNRQLQTIDEQKIFQLAKKWQDRLQSSL